MDLQLCGCVRQTGLCIECPELIAGNVRTSNTCEMASTIILEGEYESVETWMDSATVVLRQETKRIGEQC